MCPLFKYVVLPFPCRRSLCLCSVVASTAASLPATALGDASGCESPECFFLFFLGPSALTSSSFRRLRDLVALAGKGISLSTDDDLCVVSSMLLRRLCGVDLSPSLCCFCDLSAFEQPCLYFFCKTYPQYSERLLQIPRTFAWTVLQNTIGARWRELCLVQLHAGRTASNRLQTTLV